MCGVGESGHPDQVTPVTDEPRDVRHPWTAPFRLRHYRAVAHSLHTYVRPVDGLRRYALGSGDFPCSVALRTPLGRVEVRLPHAHDMRTVNEVFCRRDYGSVAPATVLDVGANIGVSALYFLTRRPDAVVHCFEPHPDNLPVLRANVAPFADRVVVHPYAVATSSGEAEFVAEPVGRYSGLAHVVPRERGRVIRVATRSIDDVAADLVAVHGRIDLVKIDTEGTERALRDAITPPTRRGIGSVVWEDDGVIRREQWSR